MKYFFALLFVFAFAFAGKSQGITISTVKLGELKINFSIDSLNKYLDKKAKVMPLVIKNDTDARYRYDTIETSYKGLPIKLFLDNYLNYETNKLTTTLLGIYSEDKNIKTKSGIKIGDDKFDVLKKLDGYELNISPLKHMGKEFSKVTLFDFDNGGSLIFYFKNNILYAFELSLGGEEGC